MSLDYPNRADWLKVRATPRHRPNRHAHVSVQVGQIRNPETGLIENVRTPRGQGRTYRRAA